MSKSIDYGTLMHDAMRGLIQKILMDVQTTGTLPGEHHFFITFDTTHPDVQLADWLKDQYPEDITVVMQHWFDNLDVKDDGFHLTLNFGENPEAMFIPYMAIQTFVDPSVEFGLRFENTDEELDDEDEADRNEIFESILDEDPKDTPKGSADVVSLDAFRKS